MSTQHGWAVIATIDGGVQSRKFEVEAADGHDRCAVLRRGVEIVHESPVAPLFALVFHQAELGAWTPVTIAISSPVEDVIIASALELTKKRALPLVSALLNDLMKGVGLATSVNMDVDGARLRAELDRSLGAQSTSPPPPKGGA